MTYFPPVYVRAERGHDFEQNRGAYSAALIAGDAEASHRVLDQILSKQIPLGKIHTEVIAPALVSIGDLWCRGDIGVAEEHLATQIVLSHLDRLSTLFAWRERRSSYRVLIACVEGERHYLGARMFADLCLSHGWNTDFLGPDVPAGALLDLARKRRPQLVGLSATMPQGAAQARRLVGELGSLAPAPRIILGGQALANPLLRKNTTGIGERAPDLLDGIELAKKYLRANRPAVVLKEYLLALGRRVRDLRSRKSWTQEQLAEAARVTRVCIVAVEGGKQNVSMDIVVRIANALGVSPENLLASDPEYWQPSRRNG